MLRSGPAGPYEHDGAPPSRTDPLGTHAGGQLPPNPLQHSPSREDPGEDAEPSFDSIDDEGTFVYENHNIDELPPQLTESIAGRRALKKLSLKGNNLTAVPPSFGQLEELYYLNLSHNQLAEVPECIGELRSLEILDMSHNALKTLPAALTRLPQLMGLSVVANNFEVLPPVIADLPKLVILEIEDNPIKLPARLPDAGDHDDEESWLNAVRECIRTHRAELENSSGVQRPRVPQPPSSLRHANSEETVPRGAYERVRSASESQGAGSSLRAAKRMGFVMSRNATDQSYVANLHARGLSHDSHMLESMAGPQKQSAHSQQLSSPGPAASAAMQIDLSKVNAEPFTHARSISSLAVTSEYQDLQPPQPRSPIARSPFSSPWGSPRPSIAESEPQSAASGRLSTLAEEHDASSDTEGTDVDPSSLPRESQASQAGPAGPTGQASGSTSGSGGFGGGSGGFGSGSGGFGGPGTELDDGQSPSVLFKDSYQDTAFSRPSVTTLATSRTTSRSTSTSSTNHRASSTPSLPTPVSANSNALENIGFALDEFGNMLASIWQTLPSVITVTLKEAQEALHSRKFPRALSLFSLLLDRLTVPSTFQQMCSKLNRRQQRRYATCIMLTFPELEAAWRQLQQSQLLPLMMDAATQQQSWAQDEQLHNQLDYATKGAQVVLILLNDVVAKSAVAAADGPEPTVTMTSRVRDLSGVCIRCSSATRSVRKLLDNQAATHARTLQLSERRRFWDEVNTFLKAVISTLAAVKAALPDMPLLGDAHVGAEVANLTKVAKEIPPLLEQSSYRLLLDSTAPAIPDPSELNTPVHAHGTGDTSGFPTPLMASQLSKQQQQLQQQQLQQQQLQQQHAQSQHSANAQSPFFSTMTPGSQQPALSSQTSLPLPTPLTASLGAAAQALISPSERVERPGDGYIQFGLHAHMDK